MRKATTLIIALLLITVFTGLTFAEEAAEFYKGKQLTVLVPYSPGGGFDTMTRVTAPFLEKYMPGTTIIVKNVPGAGGMKGMNELYFSNVDGLTIGIVNGTGGIVSNLRKDPGVKYELDKFNYLGRVVLEPKVVVTSSKSNLKTYEDVLNSSSPVTVATNGPGSGDHNAILITLNAVGANSRFVTGFSGSSEANLSVVRNETRLTEASYSGMAALIEQGDLRPLWVVSSEVPEGLEDFNVPTVVELASNEEEEKVLDLVVSLFEVERCFAAPPEVSQDKVDYLRSVFARVVEDPEFLAKASSSNLPVSYLAGTKIQDKIKALTENTDLLGDLINR